MLLASPSIKELPGSSLTGGGVHLGAADASTPRPLSAVGKRASTLLPRVYAAAASAINFCVFAAIQRHIRARRYAAGHERKDTEDHFEGGTMLMADPSKPGQPRDLATVGKRVSTLLPKQYGGGHERKDTEDHFDGATMLMAPDAPTHVRSGSITDTAAAPPRDLAAVGRRASTLLPSVYGGTHNLDDTDSHFAGGSMAFDPEKCAPDEEGSPYSPKPLEDDEVAAWRATLMQSKLAKAAGAPALTLADMTSAKSGFRGGRSSTGLESGHARLERRSSELAPSRTPSPRPLSRASSPRRSISGSPTQHLPRFSGSPVRSMSPPARR